MADACPRSRPLSTNERDVPLAQRDGFGIVGGQKFTETPNAARIRGIPRPAPVTPERFEGRHVKVRELHDHFEKASTTGAGQRAVVQVERSPTRARAAAKINYSAQIQFKI